MGSVFDFLRSPDADISWVEASCRVGGARACASGDGGGLPSVSSVATPAPRLWERFLALRRHGPFVLHQDEPLETKASLHAFMALPFDGVDAAWMHFWRLYLCTVTPPVETIDLRRLLLHLTNARTVQSLRTSSGQNGKAQQQQQPGKFGTPRDWGGGTSRIGDEIGATESSANGLVANLLNPRALSAAAVAHLGKWGLNETALLLEMIMSSGAVTGVRIGGAARKKESERYWLDNTSPFMGHLGTILSSNGNVTYLDICTTFRFDRLSGRPIGLRGLLRAMDSNRGGTACLVRLDLGAGCGPLPKKRRTSRKKKMSNSRMRTFTTTVKDDGNETEENADDNSLDVSYVGDSSSDFAATSFLSAVADHTNSSDSAAAADMDRSRHRSRDATAAATPKQRASSAQRADIRESHWSAVATILVEGVAHCTTIREVGLYGCHRADCANILLPAVAKMLLLTTGRLQAVRLPGCTFPPPSSPVPNASKNQNKIASSSKQAASRGSPNSSGRRRTRRKGPHSNSEATVLLYNAIVAASTSANPPAALCTLDISDSTMGSHAAMLLAKSCQHLKYVNLERVSAPANGYQCFLRMLSEQSRSLNPHALRLARQPTRLQQKAFHAGYSSGGTYRNVDQSVSGDNTAAPGARAKTQTTRRRPKALVQSSRLQRQKIGTNTNKKNKKRHSSFSAKPASKHKSRGSSYLSTRGGVIFRSQRESRGGLHACSTATQAGDHFLSRRGQGGGGAGGPFSVPVSATPSFAVMSGVAPLHPPSFVQDPSVILLAVDAARVRAPHLLFLDLRFMGLGQAGGTGVASALRACTRLTHVDLSGNDIGSVGSNALLQALYPSCATSLVVLCLSDNRMGDSVGHALAKTLSLCRSLVTLGLAGNRLTNDSASLMWSSALGKGCCPRLLDVDLSRNRIDSSVCMLQAYRESRRRLLVVESGRQGDGLSGTTSPGAGTSRSNNWSGAHSQLDPTGRSMARERRLLCLEKVDLSNNMLEESSASILADILQLRYRDDDTLGTSTSTSSGLGSSLLLRSGTAKSPGRRRQHAGRGNDSAFDALRASRHSHDNSLPPPAPSLTYLDLSYNMLGARGGSHIGRGLAGSIYIRELRLRGCRLGSVGSLAIAKGLYKNGGTLCVLDLSENLICCDTRSINAGGTFGLELHAVRQLCDAVSLETKANSLTTLVLSSNELGRSGAEMLRDAVKTNRRLTVLDLTGNHLVDMRSLGTIEKRLAENRKFTLIQSPLNSPTPGALRVASVVKSAVAVASEAMASWEDFSSTSTMRVDGQQLKRSAYQTLRASNALRRSPHRTVSPPRRSDASGGHGTDDDAVFANILLEAKQHNNGSKSLWQSTVELDQPIKDTSSKKRWGAGEKVAVEQIKIGRAASLVRTNTKMVTIKKKKKKKVPVQKKERKASSIPDLETASRIVLQGMPTEELDEGALARALSRLQAVKDFM